MPDAAPNNKVINRLVIDADDDSIQDFIEQYRGLPAADLFKQHYGVGANDPVSAWGCGPATAWHFEPWKPGDPLVMVIETVNARPVPWFEFVLGYDVGFPKVEMCSACPQGGFAGYAAIEGQQLEVDKLKDTEAALFERFFAECRSARQFAADHGY